MSEFGTIQNSIYPLTITSDRYSGAYSGGSFIAWNLDAYDIPDDIYGDDVCCMEFWDNNKIVVGKGNTIEEAIAMLYIALHCRKDGADNERVDC